jgi:hypothetical protein
VCLQNKKEVVLHIITIEPKDWKNLSDISVNNQTLEKKTDLELNCNTPGDTLNKNKHSCDVDDTDQVVERNYCDEKSKKRRLENNASCDITTDDIVSEDSSSISKTLTINLQDNCSSLFVLHLAIASSFMSFGLVNTYNSFIMLYISAEYKRLNGFCVEKKSRSISKIKCLSLKNLYKFCKLIVNVLEMEELSSDTMS